MMASPINTLPITIPNDVFWSSSISLRMENGQTHRMMRNPTANTAIPSRAYTSDATKGFKNSIVSTSPRDPYVYHGSGPLGDESGLPRQVALPVTAALGAASSDIGPCSRRALDWTHANPSGSRPISASLPRLCSKVSNDDEIVRSFTPDSGLRQQLRVIGHAHLIPCEHIPIGLRCGYIQA